MAVSELILGSQRFQVSRMSLTRKCKIFLEDPGLLLRPYEVQSRVSRDNFQVFVEAINGGKTVITDGNVLDLELLCKEFKFEDLSGQVGHWLAVNSSINREARRELMNQQGRIDDLERKLRKQGKEVFERLDGHERSILTVESDTKQQHERFEINEVRATAQQKDNETLREALTTLKGLMERHERVIAELQKDNQNRRQEIENMKQVQSCQGDEIRNLRNESIRQQSDFTVMKTEGEKQKQAQQEEHELLDGKIARQENEINEVRDEVKHLLGKVQENLSNFQKELAKLKEQMDKWEITQGFTPDRQSSSSPAAELPAILARPAPPTIPVPQVPAKKNAVDSTNPIDKRDRQSQSPPKPVCVTPQGKQFIPSDALFKANKWKPETDRAKAPKVPLNGIIAHLTAKCGGNVHDHNIVTVTSSNPVNGRFLAKYAVDLEKRGSWFCSSYRKKGENIPHTPNNWICYDFGSRRIILTHYTIRTLENGVNEWHLKNWIVEISRDGKKWTEIDRKENSSEMNGYSVTRTFTVSGGGECKLIRLVNIGENWYGHDGLLVSAWEVFGTLLED